MSLEEYTVSKNTGHVEQAMGGMTEAQIADIEKRAKAQVVEADVETQKAHAAETKSQATAGNNNEAGLYGDIALEAAAPGLKLVKTAVDFIDARKMDAAAGGLENKDIKAVTGGAQARTMDQDIRTANRAPGLYRAPVGVSVYGGPQSKSEINVSSTASAAKTGKLSAAQGEDIMIRANIAETSLKDHGKEALGSWGVKDAQIGAVKEAKALTFGMRNSNELALQSAMAARHHNSATMHKVNQMAPGLSLASGPTIRPDQLLREAESYKSASDWIERA